MNPTPTAGRNQAHSLPCAHRFEHAGGHAAVPLVPLSLSHTINTTRKTENKYSSGSAKHRSASSPSFAFPQMLPSRFNPPRFALLCRKRHKIPSCSLSVGLQPHWLRRAACYQPAKSVPAALSPSGSILNHRSTGVNKIQVPAFLQATLEPTQRSHLPIIKDP